MVICINNANKLETIKYGNAHSRGDTLANRTKADAHNFYGRHIKSNKWRNKIKIGSNCICNHYRTSCFLVHQEILIHHKNY